MVGKRSHSSAQQLDLAFGQLRDALLALVGAEPLTVTTHTVDELLDRWWEKMYPKWCESSRRTNASLRKIVSKHVGKLDCREVQPDHAREIRAACDGRPMGGYAVNMLVRVLAYGHQIGWSELLDVEKYHTPRRERVMAVDELRRLYRRLGELEQTYRAAGRSERAVACACARLILLTGLSQSDARRLRRRHVHQRWGSVDLGPRKGSKNRTVPVCREAIEIALGQSGEDYLFGEKEPVCSETLRRVWREACRLENIDHREVTPHVARHTVGTWVAQRRGSPRDVQVALGHMTTTSALVYVHAVDSQVREHVDAFGREVVGG